MGILWNPTQTCRDWKSRASRPCTGQTKKDAYCTLFCVKLAYGLNIRLQSGEPGNALAFPCDDDVLPGSKLQVVFQVGFHFLHRDQRIAADVIVSVDLL